MVLEKTLESSSDCKEIRSVNPKGNKSWVFTGRTVAEVEAPIFWPPDAKNWLIGKDPYAGKDWRKEEKEVTEDELLDGITNSMDTSLSKLHETVKDGNFGVLQSMGSERVWNNWVMEQQQHSIQYCVSPHLVIFFFIKLFAFIHNVSRKQKTNKIPLFEVFLVIRKMKNGTA